jgi:probable F420-dependent oxidoreductase
MKIGVKLSPGRERTLKRAAEEAERLGFDSVWLSERVVTPLDRPHPYEPTVDPWIGLAFVAAVTEKVKLGTSVSQIALRPPVLMARELATLDRLSEGRLIVGAGAGWVVDEFVSTGVPFDDRGGRLNECIRLLRHLWSDPGTAWHGKYYDVPAAGIVMPATPGGPPIFVGGFLEPGLRRAARLGDGFLAVNAAPSELAKVRARIEAFRVEYGRTGPFPFYAQASPPASIDDARAMVAEHAAAGLDGLILTYEGDVPDAFLRTADVARALIETGESV